MAQFPSLPLWTDAWEADTHHLSDEEIGLYIRLLVLMWRTPECRVPNDDAWLRKHLKQSVSSTLLNSLIKEFCQCDGNWITQKRLSHEFDYVKNQASRQAIRASVRWRKEKGNAASGIAPTPTPTPIRRIESVLADTLSSSGTHPLPQSPLPQSDGTPLPQSFEPNFDNLMLADQLGLDPQTETAKFKEIFVNQKPRRNWNARFSQFLREQADKHRKDNGHDSRTLTEKGRDLCAELRLRDMDEFGSPPRSNLLGRPVPKFSKG